jgi:Fur family peroxide stress response transcriptional regulator
LKPSETLKPEDLVRARNLRCTPQRFAVLEFLVQNAGHPTADEIFQKINRIYPRASRATVYNNLRALMDAGLVREFVQASRSSRFGAQVERHHHFICDRCGTIEDIGWFDLKGVARRREFGPRAVREYELVLRGLCAPCRAARPGKTSKRLRSN